MRSAWLGFVVFAAALSIPTAASAESPPCEPFTVVASTVSEGTTVAKNARLFVNYSACGGTGEVRLLRDGMPVDAAVEYGAAILPSVFAAVKPAAALEPGPYVLEVKRDAYKQQSLAFSVADVEVVSDAQTPSIEVVSSMWTSTANSTGLASAYFELKLATSAPSKGGVYYVDRAVAQDRSWSVTSTAVVADQGAASVSAHASWAVRAGEQVCFTLTYEDATGKLTEAAAPTCAVVPGAPRAEPDGEGADGSSADTGCAATRSRSSGARSSVLVGLVGLVAGAALRRRRRSA